MPQLVPDTAEMRFLWSGSSGSDLEGCEAEMTLYVRDTTPPGWTQLFLDQLAAFGRDWWQAGKNAGTPFRDSVSTAWLLDLVKTRDIGSATGLESTLVVNTNGAMLGDPAPPNVAMLVKFRCDPGAFPKQGWVFAPVGTESQLAGNNWELPFLADVTQQFIDFNTDLNDPLAGGVVTWAQVRVSRSLGTVDVVKSRAVARVTAETNTLAEITTKEEVASQRDRRASI